MSLGRYTHFDSDPNYLCITIALNVSLGCVSCGLTMLQVSDNLSHSHTPTLSIFILSYAIKKVKHPTAEKWLKQLNSKHPPKSIWIEFFKPLRFVIAKVLSILIGTVTVAYGAELLQFIVRPDVPRFFGRGVDYPIIQLIIIVGVTWAVVATARRARYQDISI